MITVSQLIKHLNSFPPNSVVLLSSDAEGNSYSSVDKASISYIDPGYSGGRLDYAFTEDELDDEEDYGTNFEKIVIIWPA